MLLVTGATGTIGRPLIDVLLDEGVKVRAVTHGPQAAHLRGVQLVAILAEVLGRPLRHRELPPEAATQGMLAQGLPEPLSRP
jgi:uncharacterized protein YbjT (DUF2867 family)